MPGAPVIRFHQENWISSPRQSRPVRVSPRTMFVSMRKAAACRRSVSGPHGTPWLVVEAQELGEHGLLGVSVVVLQQLDAVDRGEGEQGRHLATPRAGSCFSIARSLRCRIATRKLPCTGCRLKEGLVDEVGAGLQLLADQVEHPVDHVARSEDLAVGLDAVPGLHHLLLDDRLRHRFWLGHMHSSLLQAEASRQTLAAPSDGSLLPAGGPTDGKRQVRRNRPGRPRASRRSRRPLVDRIPFAGERRVSPEPTHRSRRAAAIAGSAPGKNRTCARGLGSRVRHQDRVHVLAGPRGSAPSGSPRARSRTSRTAGSPARSTGRRAARASARPPSRAHSTAASSSAHPTPWRRASFATIRPRSATWALAGCASRATESRPTSAPSSRSATNTAACA